MSTFAITNPATDATIDTVTDHDATQAALMVDRAQAAFEQWRRTTPRERSEVLMAAHRGMLEQSEHLADLMVAENGKSRSDAAAEVTYAAEFFRWYAEEAVRPSGSFGPAPTGPVRNIVTHHPVGVSVLITPWNFPAAMATRKIGPALAAGCSVLLKPAQETPLTALAVADILTQAGLPQDVLQIATTTDAGTVVSAWLADDRVRKLSFTGSTGVGRLLLEQCAGRVVNTSMELGGNAPFIVTADADIDQAVAGAMVAKFRNTGQACTAANRFYVHADVVDAFTDAFGAKIEELTVGDAADGNQIGPVITAKAAAKITDRVDEAVAAGARVTHRATVPAGANAAFVAPQLLRDVPHDSALVREEIFGPIAPVVTWTDEDEMVRWANDTDMGLAAYVYAGELQHALQLAERLEAGMVGINRGIVSDPSAPFGGVKQSGIGREGGHFGMEEFTEAQYLSLAWD